MIIITGALGFIGSALISTLNEEFPDKRLVAVDDFSKIFKFQNITGKSIAQRVDRKQLFEWFSKFQGDIDFVIHLGARTDTMEFNVQLMEEINLKYSKKLWMLCSQSEIPLVYASSAATYGSNAICSDDHSLIMSLNPLNPYAQSKHDFDKWVLSRTEKPPIWAGLKFFNVYGPNEYHKGAMASMVFQAYRQIQKNGELYLFESHRRDTSHGEQSRDFIYVIDVVQSILHFFKNSDWNSGIYNVGTGRKWSFNQLGREIFRVLKKPEKIKYFPMPESIRNVYQYQTTAEIHKLRATGFGKPMVSLEDGIREYIEKYLLESIYY